MSFLAYPVTETQKKLLAMAGELADIFAGRAAKNDWEGRFPLENYEDLRQAGYLKLTVPKEFGGWGASLLDVALTQQRLAQGCASTALAVSMHLVAIARLVQSVNGPNELFTRICHAVVQDGAMFNTIASEPATGSPSRGGRPATTARRQPDGSWRISGMKTYTTGSYALGYYLVACSIEDEAGDAGLKPLRAERGTFLVPASAQGVRIEDTWRSLGMRGSGSNTIHLEDVHIDALSYVDEQIPASPLAQERMQAWTYPTVAVYLGIAQAARDAAVSFAQKRRPNSLNQSIASVPHIQEKVAKMDLALLQSKAVFFGLAEQFDNDPASTRPSQFAASKYLVTNHAVEIVDLAMRLVGGASLSLDLPLQRYYRDVRAGLHHPPMDDTTLSLLARDALEIQD
ncbi:acyl-CoA dehydrogenase [Ktedonosporobacter rubrisoli]|uniref:Acyl-CoA dehydrogenase n=1 Tax=Ktedonosporobacter rubrisoli TaxID=2509675 RepID=A0A4P6JU33_KTERU|nr:acyl-CoA dehydrogenase family protein [Ktedonosporobacter rubrisoli]QBD78820.1 acyl-CoA dehydrogenase [Ktedonosporobacter rubrisoli]